MANKKVGVDIAFNADTSRAKASIQELQTLLNKITYSGASGSGSKNQMAEQLQSASAAAKELQYHLNNAFNAKTGKLDLSLLDKSLASTNSDITKLSTNLLSAGTSGQQAFVKVAQAIAQAEQPMVRVNDKLKEFAVSLKNAAKYQLSNAIIQGFTTSLSAAVGYAKDLNSSLNEIRIVSGKSADEMARFAEEANKTARRLSTTTTDYTKASLIYYQQGLSDKEVADRTETTIKMANVAGTSAQKVSDQMTAVWNNFYDGSKSLEYYSDVMVKLGAATASSTDEISEGVNKFAATAKTVGLSYEYAASALATVTARTRESADVVGNAMKTLFARIQGLNLGETLDDGTTLNKYSKALDAVGIDIKNQNGELKDMDDILDEMGEKWGTLSRDQQTALAQTIAGVRQYSQLMALMNNWDYFKENLQVAYGSEGELKKQAEIYAESWEGAQKRVKASMQGVYQAILDDKFFISLNNGFANALGGLEAFIEGAGGVGTIITGLSSIIVGAFAHKIPDALQTVKYNFDVLTKGTEVAYQKIQAKMGRATDIFFKSKDQGGFGIEKNSAAGQEVINANQLLAVRNKLALVSDKMNNSEKQAANIAIDQIQKHQEEIVTLKKKNEEIQKSIDLKVKELETTQKFNGEYISQIKNTDRALVAQQNILANSLSAVQDERDTIAPTVRQRDEKGHFTGKLGYSESELNRLTETSNQIDWIIDAQKGITDFQNNYKNLVRDMKISMSSMGKEMLSKWLDPNGAKTQVVSFGNVFKNTLNKLQSQAKNLNKDDNFGIETIKKEIEGLERTIPDVIRESSELNQVFTQISEANSVEELNQAIAKLNNGVQNGTFEVDDLRFALESIYGKPIEDIAKNMGQMEQNAREANQQTQTLKGLIDSFSPQHLVSTSEALASAAAAAGNLVSIANSIKSIGEAISNDDLNNWERFATILSAISMIMPSTLSMFSNAGTLATFIKTSGLGAKLGMTALASGTAEAGAAAGVATVSFGGLLATLGLIVAVVATVAFVIWGLTKVFKSIKENSPEGQLEKAKKATQEMAQAAEEAQNAYEELLGTIDSYDSAIAKLDELTEGTTEFTNTLLEANEEAWKLIEAFALIKGEDWHYGEHGEIIIDEESRQRGIHSQQEKVEDVKNAQLGLEIDQINKKVALAESKLSTAEVDFLDKLEDPQRFVELAKKYIEGRNDANGTKPDLTEKEVKELAKMLQIGNGLADGWYNNAIKEVMLNGKNTLFESYLKYSGGLAEDDTLDNYYTIKNKDTTIAEEAKNIQRQMLDNSLANEEEYLNSEFKEAVKEKVLNNSDFNKKVEDEKTLITDVNSAWKEFVEGKGYVLGDNGKVYTDETHTTEMFAGYSADKKKTAIASAKVGQDLENDALAQYEAVNAITDRMSESQIKYAKALQTGDLSQLTEEEAQALQDGTADIKSLIGESNFTALSKQFGDEWNQWVVSFGETINNWKPPKFDLSTWKTQYNALQEAVKNITSDGSIDADLYNQLSQEYQEYFQLQNDGNYKLKVSAMEFKKAVEGISIDELKENIQQTATQLYSVSTSPEDIMGYTSSDNRIIDTQLIMEMGLGKEMGSATSSQELIDLTTKAAKAYQELAQSLAEYSSTISKTAETTKELDQLYREGLITLEDYNERFSVLKSTLDEDIDTEQYENLTEIIQDMAEAGDDDNWGDNEFNQVLKDDPKLAGKAASAILRFDSAVEDVKKNYKDWNKILKSGNLQDVAEITDDLANSYEDLLDISKGSLSKSFITNTENLELMEQAANGNVEAYNELAKRAGEDIIAQCKLETDFDQAAFDTALANFQSLLGDIDLPNLEVGTDLTGVDGFIAACEQLVNAAGMTATQATDYLSSMGVNAEVTNETQEIPETVANSVIPNIRYSSYSYQVPLGLPGMSVIANGTVPSIEYRSQPVTETKTVVGTGLKVTSANKSSGGGVKFNNSSNGSGSKKSSSGGGGGKTVKHAEKKNDNDKERYHTVLNQLEDLNSEYNDISKAKDRAFGKDRLKNFDAEITKTDELIDKQKEYLNAIENYLPIDLAAMIGSYEDTIGGPSILFDEKGNISNFDEIQDAMFAKYNKMADAFDEDSTDWKIFEKKYEQLEKYIEQYEETYDLLRDQEQEYQDLINQRLDAQLEKVQYTVEVKLDVSEDQVKLLEYQLGRIEDDSFKSLEAIGLLTEKANELNKQIETNKQGLNDALNLSLSTAEIAQVMAGNLSVLTNKNFTDDQISAIKEYRDNILDLNGELDDLREEVESKLMDAFDAWQEKLEKGVDTLDHYGSILESYKNIIDIVGTDALGLNDEFMNDLAQGSVDNAINKLEAVKSEYRSIENARAEAEAKLKDAQDSGDAKSAEMWEQTLADLTEKSQEAQENMLSAWEDALNKLVEQFEQSAERIAESFNKSIYNLGGLEGLGNDFDKAQNRADIMLDDYQKIYELSKLSRDINKSIDDTDLIGGKEKLKKLLGDVNALQEDGVEMSQYDLEYLQKTYDLRLAELELEEAQRAKNTVRLSKDNEGNWSYIYTQNSDAVDQAQQKYEDALYAMQDLSSNYIDEMSEKLIDTSQEMADALAELRIQDFASIDDYYAEVDRVQKYYQEQLDLQENELNKAILNNKTLYDEDWTAYHNATGYKISDTEDFVAAFKDSMLGTLMGSETDMSDFTEIIKGSLATMTEQLLQAADTYYRNLQEAMNAADTSIEDFGEDIGASIDEITAKSEEGASSIEDMADRMNTAVNDLMDTIQTWQESYGLAMEEIINDNLAVIESINELTKKLSLEDYDASVSWNLTRKDKDTPTGMASGGYTGSWGKEGKLGVLHEKELVLNATDTANMLDMLQITRDMINTIDLQTQNAKLGFGELVASTIRDPLSEVLEQNVHIIAEFPNATDHNEIEQALLNLNNTASQYANRK